MELDKLVITEKDRIVLIAPHPDDECLGAAAVLLKVPHLTDIYVMTDGCHGSSERTVEEEMAVRRRQFEAEMEYVKPHAWYWIGVEDTKLMEHFEAADRIDFTEYTKIFLPEIGSRHPDHTAAALMCCDAIRKQHATAECYSYEVLTAFHDPTHYIDISGQEEKKRRLIRFHGDQEKQERIALSLNAYRAAQLLDYDYEYVECYEKLDVYALPEAKDILIRLHTEKKF